MTVGSASPHPSRPRAAFWKLAASFLAGGFIAGVAVWNLRRPAARGAHGRERLNITLPAMAPLVGEGLPVAALSPDGSRLVYVAAQGARSILYQRRLDRIDATPISGTEGAVSPFFSPDGQWIAFQAEGRLKKIAASGGQSVALCDAPQLRGGSWGPDNTILFAADLEGGLSRVSAAGGTPRVVTKLNSSSGQTSHRWPQILPGGKAALFSTLTDSGREEEREIAVVSLETGQSHTLLRGGNYPRYASSGHLLYAKGAQLMAAPFDLERLELTGAAVPVLENIRSSPNASGLAVFDVSSVGSLIYVPATDTAGKSLLWVDRKGQTRPASHSARAFGHPALSPDGKRLAAVIHGTDDDIWTCDLERDTWTRLTFESDNQEPIWSPDGKRIVFSSNRKGPFNLFVMLADGSAPPEQLFASENWIYPNSFSPDGALVAFSEQTRSGYDIGLVAPARGASPRPFLATPLEELIPRFSPDGKWIAYVARESGHADIFVRPYPGPGAKVLVSSKGGDEPAWAPNGRELFYREGPRMMAVPIRTAPQFQAGVPEVLFEGLYEPGNEYVNYDVSADGRRFVLVKGSETPLQIVVVPDWFDELEARMRVVKK
jgi:Tol biopolymer transport system component